MNIKKKSDGIEDEMENNVEKNGKRNLEIQKMGEKWKEKFVNRKKSGKKNLVKEKNGKNFETKREENTLNFWESKINY